MNIIDQVVHHQEFGRGIIVGNEKNIIEVSFAGKVRKFQFPDAFGSYLIAEDRDLESHMELIKAQKVQSDLQLLIKTKKEASINRFAVERKRSAKKDKIDRPNIAFKCNFCDGGESHDQVGFDGVCSDAVINNNIKVEHKTWCSFEESPCFLYTEGEISREQLDLECTDGGFVCYESQLLREWKAFAGVVRSGEREGQPMKLEQIRANSLCVLTTRTPESRESERCIFGVFLVGETHHGDNRDEGYVSASSEFKLKLSPREAKKMLFWNYHSNGNKPQNPAWGSGLHRYFHNEVAAQILRDIVTVKKGKPDYSLAKSFLEHFCRINGVSLKDIGHPCGALKMKD